MSVRPPVLRRMRDRLAHRGPDAATELIEGSFAAGHRRLAVLDPDGGEQPWREPEAAWGGPVILAYNGELYEHHAMRGRLPGDWRSTCDTETLARALQVRGPDALDDVRGMYALAAWWPERRRLLLARDPLGIKPLHWTIAQTPEGRELIAASEIPAILDHPSVSADPDWATASAYLSTIRITCGERTMYRGIQVVPPGHRLIVELDGPDPVVHRQTDPRLRTIWPEADAAEPVDEDRVVTAVRTGIRDSVNAHLLADVPVGLMLSGGLDSSIIAHEVTRGEHDPHTWCGAGPDAPEADEIGQTSDDPFHAAAVAGTLGLSHTTIRIGRRRFGRRWTSLVRELGVPLGTPNEVAINAIAAHARTTVPVLLSGEGADELFVGYLPATRHIVDACSAARAGTGPAPDPTELLMQVVSWIPAEHKSRVLAPDIMSAAHDDAALWEDARALTAEAGDPADPRSHLTSLGRRNLNGLLTRLDTATMLASVEGRTPFADVMVAQLAASIPLSAMIGGAPRAAHPFDLRGGTATVATQPATSTALTSKRVLRQAWADVLPTAVLERPKESFPLPFGKWLVDQLEVLDSPIIRDVFTRDALAAVAEDPAGQRLAAWPMINLALWLQRWA